MTQASRELGDHELLQWLRLIRSPSVGPITFKHLLERYGGAEAAIDALPGLARRGGGRKTAAVCSAAEASREIEALAAFGGRFVARVEPHYPAALAALEDGPPLIAVKGHDHLLQQPAVAVVGARNASALGIRFARSLVNDLGQAGWTVVSGLARGIDAAAHQAALKTGTIAVQGGGLDVEYPKENSALYQSIMETGLIIAEAPFGTQPLARHFPRRNRLISGLSLGVVVVEAALRSGSLITARMAGEQGRQVFAVPGSPLDPRSQGANALLRDGATLVRNADDVLEVLVPMKQRPLAEARTPDYLIGDQTEELENDVETPSVRERVLEALGPVPVDVDELTRLLDTEPRWMAAWLLELEIAGRIERHPGNRVSARIEAG